MTLRTVSVTVLLLIFDDFLVDAQCPGPNQYVCPLLLPTAANSCEQTCTNTALPCTSNVICNPLLNLGQCACSTNYYRSWDGSSCVPLSGCTTTITSTTTTSTTTTTKPTTTSTTTTPTTTSTTTTTTPTTTSTTTTPTTTSTTTTTTLTTTTSTTTPTTTSTTTISTPTTTTSTTTTTTKQTTIPLACLSSQYIESLLLPISDVPQVVQAEIANLTVSLVTSSSDGFLLSCNCTGIPRYGCQIALTTSVYTSSQTVEFTSYTVNGDQTPITTPLITCNIDGSYSSAAPVANNFTSGTGGFFDEILCFGFGPYVCEPLSANHATFLYDPPSTPYYNGAVATLSCDTAIAISGVTEVTCANGVWVGETLLQTCT